jgi:acetyltransferase-like isoleucine patch superfamily enzyme
MSNPDVHETQDLAAYGLETLGARCIADTLVFERPAYLLAPQRIKGCSIGAFSYINGQNKTSLYECNVGRFCSIAEGAVIGPAEHPISWLSSHVFLMTGPDKEKMFYRFPEYTRLATEKSSVDEINPPVTWLGNDVWIGCNVFVKRGVRIGDGAIIAANSVVTKDVPPYVIVGGNPGRLIRHRFDEHTIERLLALQWWRYDLAPHKHDIAFRQIELALDQLEDMAANGKLEELKPLRYSVAPMATGYAVTELDPA